jgi:hypothetical protein
MIVQLTTGTFRWSSPYRVLKLSGIESAQNRPEDGADPNLVFGVALKTDCLVKTFGGGSLNAKAPGCNPAVGHHAMVVQVHPAPPEGRTVSSECSGQRCL